jgi:hypothetical protein
VSDFHQKGKGPGLRNDARSGAERVPLMLIADTSDSEVLVKFEVSKAELLEGLKFIKESNGDEQRQARTRLLFSRLIATSYK